MGRVEGDIAGVVLSLNAREEFPLLFAKTFMCQLPQWIKEIYVMVEVSKCS